MKRLSSSEIKFLEEGIAKNIRTDGRGSMDMRPFVLETGILSQTNGSARVKLAETDILVGIKLETGDPSPPRPDEGRIQFSIERASIEFEPFASDNLSVELSSFMQEILKKALDLRNLSIIHGKLCWIVYVDVMILGYGGNLYGAISIATRAALFNTLIPKVDINVDAEEFEVSEDPESFSRFNIEKIPVCITFNKIGEGHVVDATIEEEICMTVQLITAVDQHGNLCAIQKVGRGGIHPSSLNEMILSAQKIGRQVIEKLNETLLIEESLGKQKRKAF